MPAPTTQELVDRGIATIEGKLNQKSPPADYAFTPVLATQQAMAHRSMYALLDDRAKANLAISAKGDDLDRIGESYGVTRGQKTAWEGTATYPCDDGTVIGVNVLFRGPQGLQYQVKAQVEAPTGAAGAGATLTLVCLEAGIAGSLADGSELTIVSPIAGGGQTATVTATTVTATERENDDDYRIPVLDEIRSDGGGGNKADMRRWSNQVAGVKRAYPFTGPPWDSGITPLPGMRTVYVEAEASVNADGIAPSGLLASVKTSILADPDTGESREILGLTTDVLYTQSIFRTPIYVKVVGLTAASGSESAAETAVEDAIALFLRQFRPFVQGLDPDFDKMNSLDGVSLGAEVREVLRAYGGSAQNVLFGLSVGSYIGKHDLENGETLKLGGIIFEAAA